MSTVLVVDDDPDVRLMLRLRLERAEVEVLLAEDGDTGLALALRCSPDLVLLDHRMPGRTGIQVARELRARGFPGVVVMFTAHVSDQLEAELDELELPSISKVHLQELTEMVEQLIPAV